MVDFILYRKNYWSNNKKKPCKYISNYYMAVFPDHRQIQRPYRFTKIFISQLHKTVFLIFTGCNVKEQGKPSKM